LSNVDIDDDDDDDDDATAKDDDNIKTANRIPYAFFPNRPLSFRVLSIWFQIVASSVKYVRNVISGRQRSSLAVFI
jgi:hypothetical protein